jgi:hypothetical protein
MNLERGRVLFVGIKKSFGFGEKRKAIKSMLLSSNKIR